MGKQVKAADPGLRSKCLSRFNVKDCRQPCVDSDISALPNLPNNFDGNFEITVEDAECNDQFNDFYNSVLITLPEYQILAQNELLDIAQESDEDSQITCYIRPARNIVE